MYSEVFKEVSDQAVGEDRTSVRDNSLRDAEVGDDVRLQEVQE